MFEAHNTKPIIKVVGKVSGIDCFFSSYFISCLFYIISAFKFHS